MSPLFFDPVTGDPPELDAIYPPSYTGVAIPSSGDWLYGTAYIAQGQGPHPVAVFLHGLPGNERNLDLAQAARRAGWTTLAVSYRGAWGSSGQFSFAHALEDVRAILNWLRTTEARDQIRADGARVALVGLSMGAWAALLTAAETPALLGAAALAPWNVGAYAAMAAEPGARSAAIHFLETLTRPLQSIGAERLLDEALAHIEDWDFTRHADALKDRALLVVAVEDDDEAPPPMHYAPLAAALRGAPSVRLEQLEGADHAFSARRIGLARTVIEWLDTLRRD
jgi:pimeloyl-ACP methyl ester carboxylesterase